MKFFIELLYIKIFFFELNFECNFISRTKQHTNYSLIPFHLIPRIQHRVPSSFSRHTISSTIHSFLHLLAPSVESTNRVRGSISRVSSLQFPALYDRFSQYQAQEDRRVNSTRSHVDPPIPFQKPQHTHIHTHTHTHTSRRVEKQDNEFFFNLYI